MNINHNEDMRKAVAAVVVTSALFSTSLLAPIARAEVSPTPSPTSAPLTPLEQFRIARLNYFAAMKLITAAFKSACDRANLNYATAIALAKGKDQKRAARLVRESAITAATIAFEDAKSELGPMPVEPLRTAKAPGKSRAKLR